MALIWTADYDKATTLTGQAGALGVTQTWAPADVWQSVQTPHSPGWTGTDQPSRCQIIDAASVPGSGIYKPSGRALRVEVRPYNDADGDTNLSDGDVLVTSGYSASRCEVYDRHAVPGTTPAAFWPDHTSAERWYGLSIYLPPDWATVTDTTWLVVMQLKGVNGNSPPIALETKRGNLRLGGTRTNSGLIAGDGNLGALPLGTWTRIVIGVRYATDNSGWVECWRDGAQVIARTAVATMDLAGGQPDPCYLKQGIYRDIAWTSTHVAWFGPVKIGDTKAAVLNAVGDDNRYAAAR